MYSDKLRIFTRWCYNYQKHVEWQFYVLVVAAFSWH